jgi:putative ABC transport system permease protein
VDENYIPTLGIQMATGRNFSKEFATDSTGIILNETAVRALGWNNETAINKIIIRQNSERGNNTPFHIIGVVKNFNFKSLHESISPLMMSLQREGGLIFKVKTTDVAGLLSSMKTKWESYKTGEPFTYSFLDELFEKAYAAEQKTSTLLNIFAVITIFVSCLGLFGLVTYTVEQKTKEIGIRKVLGASVPQVSIMVSKEFIKLVLIACVIAFPLAWYAMHQWLQDFAFRINISWTVFVIAALMALSIALLTVGFKAVKAALSNPVRSLRTE